jgi:hypothetical protein
MSNSPTCTGVTESGEPCRAIARSGSVYCFFHDPGAKGERDAARRAGGVARSRPATVLPPDAPEPALGSAEDVVLVLGDTIRQVRKGQLDPKIANTVGYLAGVLLKAFDMGEMERRLTALEAAVQNRSPVPPAAFDPEDPLLPPEGGEGAA